MTQAEAFLLKQPQVRNVVSIYGFSLFGQGEGVCGQRIDEPDAAHDEVVGRQSKATARRGASCFAGGAASGAARSHAGRSSRVIRR